MRKMRMMVKERLLRSLEDHWSYWERDRRRHWLRAERRNSVGRSIGVSIMSAKSTGIATIQVTCASLWTSRHCKAFWAIQPEPTKQARCKGTACRNAQLRACEFYFTLERAISTCDFVQRAFLQSMKSTSNIVLIAYFSLG